MTLETMQHSNEVRGGARPTWKRSLKLASAALAQTMVVALAAVPQQAQAQAVSPLCIHNGAPIVPQTSAQQPYAWAILANFEHANSTTSTTICLAERQLNNPPTYTLINCPISNNVGGLQFGGGQGRFDGNSFATCSVTTALSVLGPPFAMSARATFPTNGVSYPLVASSDISLRVTRTAGCSLKPDSAYDTLMFGHQTGAVGCAGLHRVFSRVEPTATGAQGIHRVNGVQVGQPADLSGVVQVGTSFSLQLGGPSAPFQMDYVYIDPRGGSCCGGG